MKALINGRTSDGAEFLRTHGLHRRESAAAASKRMKGKVLMTTMRKKSSSLLTSITAILISALVFSISLSTVTAHAQTTPQPAPTPRPIQHPPLAIKAYNYTDRAIGKMKIVDAYNSKPVGILSIEPGGAFGPICCATFKGEKLTLTWDKRGLPGDPDRWAPRPRTATAIIPPYDRKTVKQIAIHIYPDEHVEVEMATKKNFMADDDKFHITDITRQLWFKNKDLYSGFGKDDDERNLRLHYKVSEFVGEAWKKYQITDYEDLLLYCYWRVLGVPIEIHPKVQALLKNAQKNPKEFAEFMLHPPKNFGEELENIENKSKKHSSQNHIAG